MSEYLEITTAYIVFCALFFFIYNILFRWECSPKGANGLTILLVLVLSQILISPIHDLEFKSGITLVEAFLLWTIFNKRDRVHSLIKVAFAFTISVVYWNVISLPVGAILYFLFQTKDYMIFTLIKSVICFLILSVIGWRISRSTKIPDTVCKKWPAMVVLSCATIVFISYSMLRRDYTAESRELNKYILLVLIFCLFVILVLVIDQATKEKREHNLIAEIGHLSSELHKSRELVPAVTRRLSDLKRSADMFGKEEISAELSIVLSEATSISTSIAAAAHSSFITNNPLQSTGLLLLDSQLEVERELAALTGVAFDVIVIESPTVIIKDYPISQLELQRILGDLVRNAIHAVERSNAQFAKILLILGRTQQGYQIQLFDTGVPFPQEILSRFGQRGSTTDGTGNGIADILEVLAKCNASLSIRQGDTGEYTKSITILFDGHGRIELPK